jgi:hypothetical protein
MRRRGSRAIACAGLLLAATSARAGSAVRYALVIGNDQADPQIAQMEPLRHAEQEARQLADNLVRFANFDPSRIETVVGKSRSEVLAAAARLAARHRADRQELGKLPTLFAFFFSGHGLSGKLLTRSGAVTGDDLAGVVRDMDASLTVGLFDACYAGSLDFVALHAKGVVVTPGFNPIIELPKEILDAEGTMWFASSKANEVSYEDERMGGLFMHYFTEAFTAAPADGVGIPLEAMWEYARRRTSEVAAEHGRIQTPEKIVRSLTARGPLYFSFPRERTASLVFDADVEGTFLIQYAQAGLAERVIKRSGAPLRVLAFDGEVVLSQLQGDGARATPSGRFLLGRGDDVVVRSDRAGVPIHSAGFAESPIRAKGELPGLALTRSRARTELALGAGYRYTAAPEGAPLAPSQWTAGGWMYRGRMSFGVQLLGGTSSHAFESWSYRLQQIGLLGSAGYGLELRGPRLDLEAEAGPSLLLLRYGSGAGRTAVGGWLGLGARLSVPIPRSNPWLLLHLRPMAGLTVSPGVAAGDGAAHFALAPALEVGLSVPLGWGAAGDRSEATGLLPGAP